MSRPMLYLIGVCLCILIALVGLSWLSAELPRVYVHTLHGQPVLGGTLDRDQVVPCIGLPHFDRRGFAFCQGALVYHPWAYSTPIDDSGSLKELQDMKRTTRGR